MPSRQILLQQHQQKLVRCRRCPEMYGPPVTGKPVLSPVMLLGQAPGNREIELHRPFAWTAGKTLFGWFSSIGLEEKAFREMIYMAAVCRCFPGKKPRGGDRVPSREEIANCRSWWQSEVDLLKPQLMIPVGKLAISQFMSVDKLDQIIGQRYRISVQEHPLDIIPLPHPSGASTWHRTEPGVTLLKKALQLIKRQPAWKQCLSG